MYGEFVKEFKLLDKNDLEKSEDLLKYIAEARNNLLNMHNNMQYADGDLIDYYAYQIKAEEAKYNYLIKLAKKKEVEG